MRIKQRRICTKDGREVPDEEVVMGYETGKGDYVVLTRDEIAAAAGEQSRVIELEEFISVPEIDPVLYDRTYYLGTGKNGKRPIGCRWKSVKAPDPVKQPEPAPDLMAALEQALAEMTAESEGRGPSQRRKQEAR